MSPFPDKTVKKLLSCTYKFKTDVDHLAQKYNTRRIKLIQEWQKLKVASISEKHSKNMVILDGELVGCDEQNFMHEILQKVSDAELFEHASRGPIALVFFGPNSCGKTSFIRRFLSLGDFLPVGNGSVSARIVQLSYAPGHQARFQIYSDISKTSIIDTGDLSHFFKNVRNPDWAMIAECLHPHLQRPSDTDTDRDKFEQWAKCFVQIFLPSPVLELNIDVYDTPGFLSDNRERVLTENMHNLVKDLKPTLVFLYDNATISDTEKSCFLAMKGTLDSMKRVPVFFLNTKADCVSIVNDYQLDDDPDNVSMEMFHDELQKKIQHCYELLLQRREMANEVIGDMPLSVSECTCFGISTIPGNYDPWKKFTDMINENTFRQIINFAANEYKQPSELLAKDILMSIEDYFDFIVASRARIPDDWDNLLVEAKQWGREFFEEYTKLLPVLLDELIGNINSLLEEQKKEISEKAAKLVRKEDPIDTLLQDHSGRILDYVKLAVREQVVKVAANQVIIRKRDEVKDMLLHHYQRDQFRMRNELLSIAQRYVLGEISPEMLQRNSLLNTFVDFIVKLPIKTTRFWLTLPTRISYKKKDQRDDISSEIVDCENRSIFKLLEDMDRYKSLSSEMNRRKLAELYLTRIAEDLPKQKNTFLFNLNEWIKEQKKNFKKTLRRSYDNIKGSVIDLEKVHDMINTFSPSFARFECQLVAAIDLSKHNGIPPAIGEELERDDFCSVHRGRWGFDENLAVKKLLEPSGKHQSMLVLEAHYHRLVCKWCPNHFKLLPYIYKHEIDEHHYEFWLMIPAYPISLRQYLIDHFDDISFARTVDFALNIATSVADLHRVGIVHRNLKTSNIMLDHDLKCNLTDFAMVHIGMLKSTIVGTLPIPLDILASSSENNILKIFYDGTLADIYSLGIILFELFPKIRNFQSDRSNVSQWQKYVRSDLQNDDKVKSYADIMRMCLHKQPTARPNAEIVVRLLRDIQRRNQAKLCIACEERERMIRFTPCGHKVTCAQCWSSWIVANPETPQCFLCKAPVTGLTENDDILATFYIRGH